MKKLIILMVLLFIPLASSTCVVPYTGMNITTNVTFCTGTYNVENINIIANNSNIWIDGNGSVFVGNYPSQQQSLFILQCKYDGSAPYTTHIKNVSVKNYYKVFVSSQCYGNWYVGLGAYDSYFENIYYLLTGPDEMFGLPFYLNFSNNVVKSTNFQSTIWGTSNYMAKNIYILNNTFESQFGYIKITRGNNVIIKDNKILRYNSNPNSVSAFFSLDYPLKATINDNYYFLNSTYYPDYVFASGSLVYLFSQYGNSEDVLIENNRVINGAIVTTNGNLKDVVVRNNYAERYGVTMQSYVQYVGWYAFNNVSFVNNTINGTVFGFGFPSGYYLMKDVKLINNTVIGNHFARVYNGVYMRNNTLIYDYHQPYSVSWRKYVGGFVISYTTTTSNDIDESNTINGIPILYMDGVNKPCQNVTGNYSHVSAIGCGIEIINQTLFSLDFVNSNVTIRDSSVGNLSYVQKTNLTSYDSSFNKLWLLSNSKATLISSDYSEITRSSGTEYSIGWYLTVIAKNLGNLAPISNALIEIKNTFDNLIHSGKTDSAGSLTTVVLEKTVNDTGTIDYNPYQIYGKAPSGEDKTDYVEVRDDTVFELLIPIAPPGVGPVVSNLLNVKLELQPTLQHLVVRDLESGMTVLDRDVRNWEIITLERGKYLFNFTKEGYKPFATEIDLVESTYVSSQLEPEGFAQLIFYDIRFFFIFIVFIILLAVVVLR